MLSSFCPLGASTPSQQEYCEDVANGLFLFANDNSIRLITKQIEIHFYFSLDNQRLATEPMPPFFDFGPFNNFSNSWIWINSASDSWSFVSIRYFLTLNNFSKYYSAKFNTMLLYKPINESLYSKSKIGKYF